MAQPEEKITLAHVLRLVDQLSPEDQLELRLELDSREPNVTWSDVSLEDPARRAVFFKQLLAKAGKRAKYAFEKLQSQGILDEKGNLLKSELPADMQPGSNCDVGG